MARPPCRAPPRPLLLAGLLLLAAPALAQEDGVLDAGGGDGDGETGTPALPSAAQTQPSTVALDSAAQEAEGAAGTTSVRQTAAPTLPPPIYRLAKNGETCILMVMEAVMIFKYESKSKEMREKQLYVDQVEPSGYCDDDEAKLVIKLPYYTLSWSFSKTPGGDRWYVNEVEVRYDKSATIFENASSTGEVKLSSRRAHGTTLFPTPVGKSFRCQEEYSVELSGDGSDSASLLLQSFRLQPFMFKADFGPAYECSPGGVPKFRSETAPIAVGSTLAVVVLLTVSGYGVYRYFKIKKVQYDTME